MASGSRLLPSSRRISSPQPARVPPFLGLTGQGPRLTGFREKATLRAQSGKHVRRLLSETGKILIPRPITGSSEEAHRPNTERVGDLLGERYVSSLQPTKELGSSIVLRRLCS